MQKVQMPTAEAKRREEEGKPLDLSRRGKRRIQRALDSHQSLQAQTSGRVRAGVRTGTTPHFKLWQADLKLKSTLQKTKTARLAELTLPGALVRSAFALLHNAGVKNVWAVTQLTIEQLLAIDGIGVKKAEALEAYLVANNVQPSWTTAE
jgi:hypothetical protein